MLEPLVVRLRRQILRAKAEVIALTATPFERTEIMTALCLADALIDELTAGMEPVEQPNEDGQ